MAGDMLGRALWITDDNMKLTGKLHLGNSIVLG